MSGILCVYCTTTRGKRPLKSDCTTGKEHRVRRRQRDVGRSLSFPPAGTPHDRHGGRLHQRLIQEGDAGMRSDGHPAAYIDGPSRPTVISVECLFKLHLKRAQMASVTHF
jgi:hypothetical protein